MRDQLDFNVRYLEALFDSLFEAFESGAATSRWWPHVKDEFMRSVAQRRREVWARRTYGGRAPASSFPSSATGEIVRDEILWHIATRLGSLYSLVPYEEVSRATREPPLIEVPGHQYLLHLGASALPAASVEPRLASGAWEGILRRLSDSVFVDFLLWLLQRRRPNLSVWELLMALSGPLRELKARRGSVDSPWERSWADATRSIGESPEREAEGFVVSVVTLVGLDDLDRVVETFIRLLPESFQSGEVRVIRGAREAVIEEALRLLLGENLPREGSWDDLITEYLCLLERRAPIEQRFAAEVDSSFQPVAWEVVLAVQGQLEHPLDAGALGFKLRPDFPVGSPFSADTGEFVYAHFRNVMAANDDEAVERCRRRLAVGLSAMGVLSIPIELEIGNVYFRREGAEGWGASMRRAALPLGASSLGDWEYIVDRFASVLVAEDDLAQRIQEALVHLSKARTTLDAEEQLHESWITLELIGANAGRRGASLLCYLPLYFPPEDFESMNGPQKAEAIKDTYTRVSRAYDEVKEGRNKALAHRERPRLDWRVLEPHALWAKRFAKEVVIVALIGWHEGARKPDDLKSLLEKAYSRRYHFPLPSPDKL